MITNTFTSIEDVKEYLRAYSVIAKNDKTHCVACNVAECISMLLDYCSEIENALGDIRAIPSVEETSEPDHPSQG